jgi:nucleotide-binding universal stress UspA family protein
MVQDIFDPNISFQIVLEKGKVYEKVCEAALHHHSGVVLMGCNSSAEKNSRYIGSNTLRTMRTCTIPVVIITAHTKTLAIESVIFPVDLAKDYTQKLHWAVRFTNLGKGVRLNLVSVLKDNDGFVVNRMAQQLTNAKEELLKLGVPHTAEIIKASGAIDNVSEIVTDYAQKLEASLIFIMTQPESTYTPYYVSSIVQEIIALSRIPVMAVTPVAVRQKVKIKN